MSNETNICFDIPHNYQALRLRVLNKAPLTANDFHLIEAGRLNRLDPMFRDQLPLIVASWQEAAAVTVAQWTRKLPVLTTNIHPSNDLIPPAIWSIIRDYEADIADLHTTFYFKPPALFCRHEMGPNMDAKAPDFHGDYSQNPNEVIYVCRLGANKLIFLRDAEIALLSVPECQHMLKLIQKARDINFGIDAQIAKKEIIASEIAHFLPLGDVAMMVPEVHKEEGDLVIKGTDHCSSDLPEHPTDDNSYNCSAFLHIAMS